MKISAALGRLTSMGLVEAGEAKPTPSLPASAGPPAGPGPGPSSGSGHGGQPSDTAKMMSSLKVGEAHISARQAGLSVMREHDVPWHED